MKTITEYQPMIFSKMAHASERRCRRNREFKADLRVSLAYAAFGFWLSADLGVTPWMWQFWMIFAPALAIAELVRFRRKGGRQAQAHPGAEQPISKIPIPVFDSGSVVHPLELKQAA